MKKFALLLLLLVSCAYVQLPGRERIPQSPEVMTGTTALEVAFDDASTNDILMCRQANVFVNFMNKGAHHIRDGMYAFIMEEQILRPIDRKQDFFTLEGKSRFNPQGGFDQISFKMQNLKLPEQRESYVSDLIMQACYKYKTIASAQVCIDPDVQNLNPQKPCTAQPVALTGGQGAPVAITTVESLMVPEEERVRPLFRIHVQHVGTGSVVTEEGAAMACTSGKPGLQLLSEANVDVELQGKRLLCSPDPVRIEPGKGTTFVCESEELYGLAAGTFSTVLSIELSYGYVNSAKLPITITRLPGQASC